MRVTGMMLVVLLIARMIYDLTWNPLDAVYRTFCVNTAKRVTVAVICILVFNILWTCTMPKLLAYKNQPLKSETHILSEMPMYGNDYIYAKEHLLAADTYRYMYKDDTAYMETRKGVEIKFCKSEVSNTLSVTYQLPKEKTLGYFFMDKSTWPVGRNDIEYLFSIVYN